MIRKWIVSEIYLVWQELVDLSPSKPDSQLLQLEAEGIKHVKALSMNIFVICIMMEL